MTAGRGLIGRRIRIGRYKRVIVGVDSTIPGAIKIDRPVEGLRWWNTDAVKFVRGDYTAGKKTVCACCPAALNCDGKKCAGPR